MSATGHWELPLSHPGGHPLMDVVMSLERLSDESIMRMYECIRDQLAADTRTPRPLMGESAKRRAEELAAEMHRRRMRFALIEWPSR